MKNNKLSHNLDLKYLGFDKPNKFKKSKKVMTDQKPLFKSPYDIKDVSVLFAIVAFVLIIAAILGNNLFGIFQENINFG